MEAGRYTRAERTAFIVAAALVFCYVAVRSVTVPIVHDEAMTFFYYVETGDFLPFKAHWDAGNHLLCTALAWISYKIFGMEAWALRLPSVLAFALYALYVWRWGLLARHAVVRRCLWAALLITPFLLDFFSLFRGYGMAMAFWLAALYHLCLLLERYSERQLAAVLLALLLANYSSLNLMPLWAAMLAVVLVKALRKPPHMRGKLAGAGLWLVLGLLPWAVAALYSMQLSLRGSLYYGVTNGLLKGSLPSLLRPMFGSAPGWMLALVLLLLVMATFIALQALWAERHKTARAWALVMCAALLWADLFARQVLFDWKGTLFPEDRTALHWVPLFVLLFAFAVDRLSLRVPKLQWAVLALLALPARGVATANTARTVLWPDQTVTPALVRAVEKEQGPAGRLRTVGAQNLVTSCWAFALRSMGVRLNAADAADFPMGGQELLLADPTWDTVPPGYRWAFTSVSGHTSLFVREAPLAVELITDSTLAMHISGQEFTELWHPDAGALAGHAYLLELELELHPEHEPWLATLVVEVENGGGGKHYESVPLQFMRGPRLGTKLRTVRRVPLLAANTQRAVVYLWNTSGASGTIAGTVRVYRAL